MKFFDPPKLPWWRRWLSRIPLLGWIFRKRIRFTKLRPPLFKMSGGTLSGLRQPIKKIIESNSVKDVQDIDESWRRWRDRPGPR